MVVSPRRIGVDYAERPVRQRRVFLCYWKKRRLRRIANILLRAGRVSHRRMTVDPLLREPHAFMSPPCFFFHLALNPVYVGFSDSSCLLCGCSLSLCPSRSSINPMYSGFSSMPTERLPSLRAATSVVPEPTNGSNTTAGTTGALHPHVAFHPTVDFGCLIPSTTLRLSSEASWTPASRWFFTDSPLYSPLTPVCSNTASDTTSSLERDMTLAH